MKLYILSAALLPIVGIATAQSPDSTLMNISVEGGSAVPTTTIIPVAKAPIKEVDTTIVNTTVTSAKIHLSRRQAQTQSYTAHLDSLIRSRNFLFYPDAMQSAEPTGVRHNIYAQYFYLGIFTDTAEVHLPTSYGRSQSGGVLNFDSGVSDFKILPFDSGWSVTFRLMHDGQPYFARIVISAITGESILSLVTPNATIRYIGQLTHKRRLHFPEV